MLAVGARSRRGRALRRDQVVPCPSCQSALEPKPVGFTWWGGLLGAKLLHHAECPACHARYNASTGRSNNAAIALYLVVAGLVMSLAFYAIMSRR